MPSTHAELCTFQGKAENTLIAHLYQNLRLSPGRNRRLRQGYRLPVGAVMHAFQYTENHLAKVGRFINSRYVR